MKCYFKISTHLQKFLDLWIERNHSKEAYLEKKMKNKYANKYKGKNIGIRIHFIENLYKRTYREDNITHWKISLNITLYLKLQNF